MIDSAVRAVHARHDLNAAIRYSAVRLAELLDPATPFALSGAAYCDPPAATSAFESAARDYLARPGMRYGTLLAASQLATDALQQEVNLERWYGGELTRLLLFLAQLRKVPTVKVAAGVRRTETSYGERGSWVRQKLQAVVAGSLARFREALQDPQAGYRARLLEDLLQRLSPGPASEREWAELEHDLCYAAALLLGEGRDGRELAGEIASRLAAADPASAIERLRELLSAGVRDFCVALVISGTRTLHGESAASFGVEVVDRARPRWSRRAPGSDAALARFVAERAPADDCTPVLVRVEAHDRGQARLRGLLAVEALRDQLVVEHPLAQVAVKPAGLVLDAAAGQAEPVGPAARPIQEGRVGRRPTTAELFPFLRANAMARNETSPALKIVHTWIALESLAAQETAGTAGGHGQAPNLKLESYLPPHLASVAAIAGLRSQLLVSWDEVRALGRHSPRQVDWTQVEGWLGAVDGRLPGLARFVELLRALNRPAPAAPPHLEAAACPEVAAAFVLGLAEDLGPFVGRRLGVLGRQLDKGSRLAKAAEAIQVRTVIATARLKLARHLAVHRGLDAEQASPPLALSGVHMLDSAFEVLQRWLEPGSSAWQAMADARRWHDGNLATWRSVSELVLDGDRLLHPRKP